MKIALLTYSTKPRGSVIHTLELAQALLELGHSPHVFALDKSGEGFHRAVDFQTFAVPASECKGSTDMLVKQRIAEFVGFFEQHAEKYDIYHAQDCLGANALSVLKERGYLTKFVRTVHHIEDFKSPYLQDCQQKSIFNSDRCLCVSDLWQKELKTKYGISAHRVVNGVSKRFTPQSRSKEDNGPLYMTVGGIEPRKNSINLLKAFAIAHQTHPTAELMIVGGATLFDYQDYRDEFMALVDHYDLADSLILPGVVSDQQLAQLYQQADAFVFPSIKEGWGLVVLEAITSGLPVVTSNQAPFTEFLSADSAILTDPADVGAIATAMLEVINPDVAAQLSAHASAILERYSWERSAKMHLDLYEDLYEKMVYT